MKINKGWTLLSLSFLLFLTSCTSTSSLEEGDLKLQLVQSSIENPVLGVNKLASKIEILSNNIHEGIYIDSIDVGGLSVDEAKKKLIDESEISINKRRLNITIEDKVKSYSLKDFEPSFDFSEALDEAYNIGRVGSKEERLEEINNCLSKGVNISSNPELNSEKLEALYDSLNSEIGVTKKIPDYSYVDNMVVAQVSDDKKVVDEKDLLSKIMNSFSYSESNDIEVVLADILDLYGRELEELNENLGNIGSSKTYYSTGDKSRAHNVWQAADRINNQVIAPGETFSFMSHFGELSSSNGYQEGSTIVNGEFVSGIGGGVCQVSTTGYQASIRAGLTIVERNHHSRPVTYTDKGSDAMVSSSWSDLKIKNDYDFPIVVKANAAGGELVISFLGDTSKKNYKITYSTEVTKVINRPVERRINKNLSPGSERVIQEGYNGYKAVMYITNHKTGETYFSHSDYYKERSKIIEYNPEIIVEENNDASMDLETEENN